MKILNTKIGTDVNSKLVPEVFISNVLNHEPIKNYTAVLSIFLLGYQNDYTTIFQ